MKKRRPLVDDAFSCLLFFVESSRSHRVATNKVCVFKGVGVVPYECFPKGVYAIKKKKVLTDTSQGAPKLFTASQSTMEAVIRSKGPMQDIMNFMTRPNKGTGAAAAKVLSSSSMKPLIKGDLKAFVTTFATGHVAIVQRDPPATYTSSYGAARRNLYGANADMTKIKKLLSPAVPHMLGNETVREQAEVLTYETLQAEIQKRVERVLNKA